MHAKTEPASADTLGALRARGADVVPFLQGQLSCDVSRLSAARSLLAGCHNPQGRVLALLQLVQLADGDLLMILPRELIAPLLQRLSKVILRAKVTLTDESNAWRITTAAAAPGSALSAPSQELPKATGAVTCVAQTRVVCVGETPLRWLVICPDGPPLPLPSGCVPVEPQSWRRLQIAAGVPQVYAAISGEFVAQMLNLDALGAIAFDKGCYTGQEVIARAHYRGRVKRRLQRFITAGPGSLNAGDSGTLRDGRPFRVVEAVTSVDGRCEFLAVAPLLADPAVATDAATLAAEPLPLPYALAP
jgi:folate-binding protein YgfZ